MKANELMIGDYVYIKSSDGEDTHIVKVKTIEERGINLFNGFIEFSELEPIPLTEEILVKNGFMRTDFLDYGGARIGISLLYKDRSNGEEGFRVLIENRSPKIETRTTIKPVKYVHEIQHTLKDLDIEKEIIL